jgi:hypothetical protein
VPARVSPAERIRAEIDQLFVDPARDLGEVIEDVARLGARLLLQTALEAEVTAFLGRERYQRDPDAGPGHRNGHQPVTVKTTSGPLTLERPKLRGTKQRFASQLLGAHVTRTNALEALVIAGFVRGLSTRDVEATLAEALGRKPPCPARRSAGSARPSAASSPPGRPAAWLTSSWTTCTWTAPAFAITLTPAPSRSWSPTASPPPAARCSSAWPRPAARATMHGRLPRQSQGPRVARPGAGGQ